MPRAASAAAPSRWPQAPAASSRTPPAKSRRASWWMNSEVHGNFIVNGGGATASEVLAMIDRIKATARETRGIELETEVKVLGDDDYTF